MVQDWTERYWKSDLGSNVETATSYSQNGHKQIDKTNDRIALYIMGNELAEVLQPKNQIP